MLKTLSTALLGAVAGAVIASAFGSRPDTAAAEQNGILQVEAFDHIGFVVEDSDAEGHRYWPERA